MHYWKASLQKRPCGYLNIDCCFVGLLWLHAQLDPDVAAAASGFSQLKEPVRGRVELHQGPHSLHPWRRGPVWEAFLVSQLHINQTEFILDLLIASTNITNYYSKRNLQNFQKKNQYLSFKSVSENFYETEDYSALCSDIAGMLLKSTGEFLDVGLRKSGNEFWESADDSTASDEIR